MLSSGDARLPLGHAVALGLLHGPAELLPVSSSAHVVLVPWILGWPSVALPGDVRKTFEVALHAGTLGALIGIVGPPPARLAVLGTLPAAIAGLALEERIERRLGGPGATALGLVAGSVVLVAADRAGRDEMAREIDDLRSADALVIGLAQAVALIPGTSRLGMAVAAARLRGFGPEAAFALGRSAGLPIMAGATVLKTVRLVQRGLEPQLRVPFAAGMAAAALATRAGAGLAHHRGVRGPAAERVALAAVALMARRARR
jgi:undecaprenyl-diphosphatase